MGNEIVQPLNSMSLEQLVDKKVLLLRAMNYKCDMVLT